MKDRVHSIQSHEHYWILAAGRIDEFVDIDFRLNRIATNRRTNTKDRAYLEKVERELERLSPGMRTWIIEGEERQVPTLYSGDT